MQCRYCNRNHHKLWNFFSLEISYTQKLKSTTRYRDLYLIFYQYEKELLLDSHVNHFNFMMFQKQLLARLLDRVVLFAEFWSWPFQSPSWLTTSQIITVNKKNWKPRRVSQRKSFELLELYEIKKFYAVIPSCPVDAF